MTQQIVPSSGVIAYNITLLTHSMRAIQLTKFILYTSVFVSSTIAIWDPSSFNPSRQKPLLDHKEHQSMMDKILSGIVQPQGTAPDDDVNSKSSDTPVISDVLPKTKAINIFARLTRDFDAIANRLNNGSKNITVLAPRNSAIQALPRKPWENPADYEKFGEVNAYEGSDGQDRAKRNLQRFVEAHIIPVSPWRVGEEVETLAGEKLKWTKEGDKMFIQPGNIEVDSVAEKVHNGEVWVLNDVINYRQE
ncbi:uncharacterized protein N7506_001206 [Penicillium brevicompactum]|uniref:uncharacterized protein n=1 Tax=Penicillium brevicompactum TaxID=5074 RepID=UPI002541EBD0|nr:uncharacterized protein N7506_001206 [Penicillium brevicompactum]KAJ5347953.1 hypothetical protein N7506_001206 [Penicillium brevicompactum]